VVLPADAKGPVPVMIDVRRPRHSRGRVSRARFSWSRGGSGCVAGRGQWGLLRALIHRRPNNSSRTGGASWGSINPGSIQADNGAGLTKGVIGLVNQGRPRKPDDWGALRAWACGRIARARLSRVRQGGECEAGGYRSVSRYGKAALVTMAFDTRFLRGADRVVW